MNNPKILVIVGPTASGKTSLSIELAQKFNGEVISADSRQVYEGLDLGTGKVTEEEMKGVPHHLLDVEDPRNTYNVTNFVRDGREAIDAILSRNKLPIIVGGTFLYIDALLGKISTPKVPPNEILREHLETLSIEKLFKQLIDEDPVHAEKIDRSNKRRLIRALEIVEALGAVPPNIPHELYTPLTLGITLSKDALRGNIAKRLIDRIKQGMIEEVQNLHAQGLSFERMEVLGLEYRYIAEFLQNKITREEMMTQIETKSMQYAKRQMTWLKRNQEIKWFESRDQGGIENLVKQFLVGQQ
ncbi:MAG: tRNA (adenosine(37)-N6)-dimethylallyltransferase MiaA [Minisyncoccia bacterium]